jgi:hypothetical protein
MKVTSNDILLFAILVLSVWRIASLFARERGPFDLFVRVRQFIYIRTVYNFLQKLFITLNDGIVCMWCNSVWFSAIAALVICDSIISWIVYTLAISAAAILVEVNLNDKS